MNDDNDDDDDDDDDDEYDDDADVDDDISLPSDMEVLSLLGRPARSTEESNSPMKCDLMTMMMMMVMTMTMTMMTVMMMMMMVMMNDAALGNATAIPEPGQVVRVSSGHCGRKW